MIKCLEDLVIIILFIFILIRFKLMFKVLCFKSIWFIYIIMFFIKFNFIFKKRELEEWKRDILNVIDI